MNSPASGRSEAGGATDKRSECDWGQCVQSLFLSTVEVPWYLNIPVGGDGPSSPHHPTETPPDEIPLRWGFDTDQMSGPVTVCPTHLKEVAERVSEAVDAEPAQRVVQKARENEAEGHGGGQT